MAKAVIIKLTTAGTSTGPFNLLSDYDSYVTPFETNIAKTTLVTGYTSSLVPNTATTIRVLSSGSCTNYVNLLISGSTPSGFTLYLASTGPNACGQISGSTLTNPLYTPSTASYCNIDTLLSTEIVALGVGTYYVSDGTNVRAWTKSTTPTNLFAPTSCSSCPITTTTSTTTTTTTVAFSTFSIRNTLSLLTVCAEPTQSVFTAFGETITTGTVVYTNSLLSLPLLNGGFIVDVAVGDIYNINSGNGQIGSAAGNC